MEKKELIEKLKKLEHLDDNEYTHREADVLLIEFINDPGVKEAYGNVGKWYS